MSAPWDSLISAGAGLLGAVIGVLGALLASRRASRTAFEQVRFAVRYERKAQVMAAAYDKVGIMRDKLTLVAAAARAQKDSPEEERRIREFVESSLDAEAYLNRNAVWNDPEIDRALRHMHQRCTLLWDKFRAAVRSGVSGSELERARKELFDGLNGEAREAISNQMKGIGQIMQQKLELEKPPPGQ